jgi:hypothetical protein
MNTRLLSLVTVNLAVGLFTYTAPLGAQTCTAPPTGLVAWWPGEGNADDLIGAHHGVPGPGVSYGPGKVGNAFRFVDSAESYILLPNTPAFQPASNQLTIAAWVKPDFSGTLNLMDHIIAKRDACGGEAYSYSFAIIKGVGGYPTGSFGLGMLPQIPWIASTNRIPDDGQFHHVAVTYNGDKTNDNCVLYLDGQIAGGGDGPGTIPVTGFGPTIGRLTPCGYYSKMDLDELAFFDRELSSAEIQAIFAASSAGMCPPQCVSPPSDLVGWWPGEGHFFDLVGGNHGVPLGNVTFAQAEVGRGFRFNGDGSAIFIPPSPATDVGAQAGLTVEAWLQPVGSRLIMWFSWAAEGEFSYGPFGYLRENNSAFFSIVDTLGTWHTIETQPNTVVLGEMQQLALTYDKASGVAAIYRNGQLVTNQNLGAFTPATAGRQMVLGRQPPSWAYEGVLDEFALFKRALSASEIAANYAARSAGMCQDLKFLAQPQNAVAYVGVSNAAMFATTTGKWPVTYQWYRGNNLLAGQTNRALTLPNPQFADAGSYTVIITDATAASLTSAPPATLTVKLCETAPVSLAGWWSGDGHCFDLSANHNHGTAAGVVDFVPGKTGLAFRLGAAASGIVLGSPPSLQLQDFTIEAWVKRSSVSEASYDHAGSGQFLACGPGGYVFGIRDAGTILLAKAGVLALDSHLVVTDTNYHHVAVTKLGSTVVFYVDGVADPVAGFPLTFEFAGPVAIGSYPSGGSLTMTFLGQIDELAVYSRNLSADEIASLYAAGNAGKCKELKFITDLSPTNQTRGVTGQASFTSLVSGSGPLTYVWRHGGTAFATNGTGSLVLSNLSLTAAGNYDVAVSDLNLVSVTSQVAELNLVDRSPLYACLAGWWPGEGNANDALGLSDGTLQGSVLFTNGIIGSAFYPNGGYVDLGVGPALDSFTVETWIWVDPAQNVGEQRVISHDNYTLSGTRKGFLIKSTSAANTGQDGSPWLGIGGLSGWQGLAAPQPLSAGWHHLAGVRDTAAGRLELYVDGALVASGALSVPDTIDSPVSTVLSGINPSVKSEPFHGRIDEVSIYTCALSANEIAAIYNTRPALPEQPDRVIPELTTLVVTNTASDPGRPFNVLTYALLGGPPNATINTNTGVITWTPTEAQGPSSNHFVTVVTDNGLPPLSDTNTFSVLVNEVNLPPTLTVPTNQTINELAAWSASATATDLDIPNNILTFEKVGATPVGLTVSPTGLIQWTPTEAQGSSTNTVTVRVYDNGVPSLSATNSFTIVVREVNFAPVLTVPTNQVMAELTTLTVTNVATDSDIPANILTFQLLAGPTNAVLNTNTGVFTWTPTEAQGPSSNWITVRVFDNGTPSLSATGSFAVVVLEVNVAPVLPTNIPSQTVMESQLLTVNSTATDADIPTNKLTYSLLSPPLGASVNTNGIVTWTPSRAQAGSTYTLRVKVTDDGAPPLSATNSFTVQVEFLNRPPVLNPIADQTVDEMKLLQLAFTASDPDAGQTLTFGFGSTPPLGAVLDQVTGVFTWTPSEAQGPGTYPITVVVTDNGSAFGGINLSTNQTFTVTVREVNRPPVLAFIPDYTVHAGETVSLRASATDPDVPTNSLAFALDVFALLPPEPTNATLNAASGQFRWPTTEADAGNLIYFAVSVMDNGTPPLTSSRGFTVEVLPGVTVSISYTAEKKPRLAWNTIVGRRYQLRIKTELAESSWTALGAPVTATGATAVVVDDSLGASTRRFYRVEVLPAP